jgi:hypothetical protein
VFSVHFFVLVAMMALVFYAVYRAYLLVGLLTLIDRSKTWLPIDAKLVDLRFYTRKLDPSVAGRISTVVHLYAIYSVDGRDFGMRRVNFHNYISKMAQIRLKQFSIGDTVRIYADPKTPHESVFLSAEEHSTLYCWLKTIVPIILASAILWAWL